MATVGELYVPGSAGEIRDDMLTDIRLEMIAQGITDDPPVQPGTDLYIWADAVANSAMLQYANIALLSDAANPNDAEGEDLDKWREALGLPEVVASGSSGKIKVTVEGGGTATFGGGEQGVLDNGLRIEVSGAHVGIVDAAEVAVTALDTGTDTNAEPGYSVRWANPPINVATDAEVSANVPLTGGTDEENDDRKRTRILNRLRNPPGGGNWSQKRETVLNALSSVQDAYIYPALGGPASERIVPVKALDTENMDYSRALSSDAMAIVRSAIHAEFDSPDEIVIQPPVDQAVDVAITLTLPNSAQTNGDGTGWTDAAPWPPLEGGDTRVSVSAVSSATTFTVNASTTTTPVANQTHVAWWSPNTRRFHLALITGVTGGTGAWVITVDQPMTDALGNDVAVNDYLSPSAASVEAYGETWVSLMNAMGPGENTADANRLPRSLRHPGIVEDAHADLTNAQLSLMRGEHPEIMDFDYSYRSSTSPTVPATVATAPSILTPQHFGIYSS